jgi:hypothetical protein
MITNLRHKSFLFEINEESQSIVIETAQLVNDTDRFLRAIEELQHRATYPRVLSWLAFFNDHYSFFLLSYSDTVFALIALEDDNALFPDQSNYEKEVSFSFYEKIFRYAPNIEVANEDSARYLMTLALVFGRYYGMVRASSIGALKNLGYVSIDHLRALFIQLFVKFENPKLLTNNLPVLNLNGLDLLMHVLQGQNPRVYPGLPMPLSRKESFFLVHASCADLDLREKFLEKVILISKFLAIHSDESMLTEFLEANHFFNFRLNEFCAHLQFWQSAYRFIANINWNLSRLNVAEIVDYFIFKRHNENKNYSLKGRTQNSIEQAIVAWHEYGYFGNLESLLKSSWGKPKKDIVLYEGEVYEFQEITDGQRLFEESEQMNHCAFSYIEMCRDGYTSVWSVSHKKNEVFKPLLTLELRRKKVYQLVQKNNRNPSELEICIVKEWMKEKGYHFLYDIDVDPELPPF